MPDLFLAIAQCLCIMSTPWEEYIKKERDPLHLVIYCNSQQAGNILFFLGAPVITIEPVETIVDAGTTIVLNCQAAGEPSPTIEWSRQGWPLLSQDRVIVLTNGSLRIAVAQKEDTSEYECVARNLMGSVLVKVPVTVQGWC